MVDREIVERLCLGIRSYVKELEQASDIDLPGYLEDNRSRRFVERVLQISIETMIDVGQHIIADLGLPEPQSYREVFQVLAQGGVLPPAFLPVCERMASFRNLLVHHYGKIDDRLVYEVFKNNIRDIEAYVSHIMEWLACQTIRGHNT